MEKTISHTNRHLSTLSRHGDDISQLFAAHMRPSVVIAVPRSCQILLAEAEDVREEWKGSLLDS